MNQRIIGTTEIVSIILDVVAEGHQQPEVMSASFSFLRAMALENPPMQKRLFDEMDRFLACGALGSGWENDMAWMLAEVFNNHQGNCVGLKSIHVSFETLQYFATTVDFPRIV